MADRQTEQPTNFHIHWPVFVSLVVVLLGLVWLLGTSFVLTRTTPVTFDPTSTASSSASGQVFLNSVYHYTLQLPADWDVGAMGGGDPTIDDIVIIDGPCGTNYQAITCGASFGVEMRANESFVTMSLLELARTQDVGSVLEIEDVTFAGEPAVLTTTDGSASYWLRHNGKLYNIKWDASALGNWGVGGSPWISDLTNTTRRAQVVTILQTMAASFEFTD